MAESRCGPRNGGNDIYKWLSNSITPHNKQKQTGVEF